MGWATAAREGLEALAHAHVLDARLLADTWRTALLSLGCTEWAA